MSTSSNNDMQTGVALMACSILATFLRQQKVREDCYKKASKCSGMTSSPPTTPKAPSTRSATQQTMHDYYPPLPPLAVRMLEASRLCHLATSSDNHSHLSLMNFTYYQAEEVIIICTRRDTKKYSQLIENSNIALLIHDFPNLRMEGAKTDMHTKTVSITLTGHCVLITDDKSEMYRALHLKHNPGKNWRRSYRIANVQARSLLAKL
jgi:nitroimidazol reductase NimA-like FMN-containing flavoprotein (pyridoxamine 5'-phosphate oxidase superfamily)